MALGVAIMERRLERGAALTDPKMAGDFCAGKLRNFDREVFGVLFLDSKHRMVGFELLFFGTIDGAEVYPREVARAALRLNAAALILGHFVSGNIMAVMCPGSFCARSAEMPIAQGLSPESAT